jgi:hypothetical protein
MRGIKTTFVLEWIPAISDADKQAIEDNINRTLHGPFESMQRGAPKFVYTTSVETKRPITTITTSWTDIARVGDITMAVRAVELILKESAWLFHTDPTIRGSLEELD